MGVGREGKMKKGVLGGTFDPVHLGHLAVAEEVKRTLGLEEMMLVIAGQPVLKSHYEVTPAEQRLEMLRLAVSDRPDLEVSTIEMGRPGPSYTVDTLDELKRRNGKNDEIYFVLGWDSLSHLTEWYQPSRIIERCYLVAVPRPGYIRPSLEDLEKKLPGISRKVILLDRPLIDISASVIREMVAQGQSIDRLVPGPVAAYIEKHKLYERD
jgi:nicotinate-nucleotide adenylyltransferase